ncbi:MAG TPA: 2TM domain-containing protein [Gaiellaceae bacterium]|nr:2TM domain-containing protein [Gaiellaceae bacterium]
MPAEMLTKNERKVSQPIPTPSVPDDYLRQWAQQHVERVRRLKLHLAAYVLGMIVLTPVWALVEWQANGAFERWSDNSNPGDWEPWILYVGLIWGFVVAFMALRTYFDRPTTDAEIDAEVRRVKSAAR